MDFSLKLQNGIKEVLMNLKKNKCTVLSHCFIWVLKKSRKVKVQRIDHKLSIVQSINIREEQIFT